MFFVRCANDNHLNAEEIKVSSLKGERPMKRVINPIQALPLRLDKTGWKQQRPAIFQSEGALSRNQFRSTSENDKNDGRSSTGTTPRTKLLPARSAREKTEQFKDQPQPEIPVRPKKISPE